MFVPVLLWDGMFCPPSHHYDITEDPEQEAIKGAAAVFAYSSMENIHPHTRPRPREGKRLPLKLAAHEKLQNIK